MWKKKKKCSKHIETKGREPLTFINIAHNAVLPLISIRTWYFPRNEALHMFVLIIFVCNARKTDWMHSMNENIVCMLRVRVRCAICNFQFDFRSLFRSICQKYFVFLCSAWNIANCFKCSIKLQISQTSNWKCSTVIFPLERTYLSSAVWAIMHIWLRCDAWQFYGH